ncbi:hypothetical protein [Cnuella takakiae]|uniref:hypothetical protein n=1 Tax=Cnuella takakiae TaxID=1302690 RepID=UPI00096BAD3B|nr:hypothetical protein [Cnuella takakiae]OLY95462.1 hypothetical protein BUE76_00575 [Cnuella takakiae]
MPKQKRNKEAVKPLKRYIPGFYLLLVTGLVCVIFFNAYKRRYSIKNSPKKYIKAVVIQERAYSGNSPVSQSFAYKYQFDVAGKKYSGTSYDEKIQPGDSIEVEYVIENPENNAPKDYYNK